MAAESGGETPKLHIDSDWKSQARAEKERLAQQEAEKRKREEALQQQRSAAAPAGAGGGAGGPLPGMMSGAGAGGSAMAAGSAAGGGPGEHGELPQANFETLVSSIASQAIMCLGAYVDPQTNAAIVDLEAGRLHIDLLGVLEEKTKGNLSAEESKLLAGLLYELRMRYVEIARAAAAAAKRGQGGVGGMPGGSTAGFVGPGGASNLGDIGNLRGDFGSSSSFGRD